jgi:hypothetical protein
MASERDKDLTSFVTPQGGLYRYRFMPFEHSNVANETLCWLMVPLRVVGQEKKKFWNTLEVIQFDVLKHK